MEAARRLDVSLSALKSACKYLGIERWIYRTRPSRLLQCSPHVPEEDSDTSSVAASFTSSSTQDESSRDGGVTCGAVVVKSFFLEEVYEEVLEYMEKSP